MVNSITYALKELGADPHGQVFENQIASAVSPPLPLIRLRQLRHNRHRGNIEPRIHIVDLAGHA